MKNQECTGEDGRSLGTGSLDGQFTLLGTIIFFLGHAVAFFFHMLWPAAVAVLGVSGGAWGFSMTVEYNVMLQSLSLIFLLGAWFVFLRKANDHDYTTRRIGLGTVLSLISLFVFYHWGQTMMLFLGGS